MCAEFDERLTADATKLGGEKNTRNKMRAPFLIANRACACGLADDSTNKQPLFFTKENTSNGDIATVDVFFPMDSAQWLFLSPALAKATLVPTSFPTPQAGTGN